MNAFFKICFRGFLLIIPIIACYVLLSKLYVTIKDTIQKIVNNNPLLDTYGQFFLGSILALLFVIGVCYVIGKISKTKQFSKISHWIDEELLVNVPAYRKLKLGLDNNLQFLLEGKKAVFVKFGENERPGFYIKKCEKNKCVVFIPKDIDNYIGHVYIVPEKNVRFSKGDLKEFIYSIEHLGKDLDIS